MYAKMRRLRAGGLLQCGTGPEYVLSCSRPLALLSYPAERLEQNQAAVDIEREDTDNPPWSLTHSWYAIMGGYSYNLREGSKVFLPDDHGRQRVVLKDEALRFVAVHEPSVIPRLSEATILDKSGAGTFVKIIALFQALWFSLQCIARMGQGLSISLLELTTFAHCVVALIIGWLWLRKPLDIQEPDPLVIPSGVEEDDDVVEENEGEKAHWLMAMLYSLSSFDGDSEADEDKWRKLTPGQHERLQQVKDKDKDEIVRSPAYLQPLGEHGPMSFSAELGWDHNRPSSSRPNTSSRPVTAAASSTPRSPLAVVRSKSPAQSLSELIQSAADAEQRLRIRMELAQKGWEHYILNAPSRSPSPTNTPVSPSTHLLQDEAKAQRHGEREEEGDKADADPLVLQRNLKRTLRNTLVDRVHNFPRGHHQPTTKQYERSGSHHSHHHHHDGAHENDTQPISITAAEQRRQTIRTHLGITLAGFLYGGLHLLAWDATFTTPAERDLWRIAALSLAASGLLVPVSHAEGYISDAVRPWLAMDEEDRDAEEAAHLRQKAKEILKGGTGGHSSRGNARWRKWAWKVYRWGFLWMIEVVRVLRVAVLVIVALVYIGLRLFVFLECLVNLVHLPPSAFEVVRWSQYVPHIT